MKYLLIIVLAIVFSCEYESIEDPANTDIVNSDTTIIDTVVTDTVIDIDTVTNVYTKYSFFVGTYTRETSQGIYKYEIDEDGFLSKISLAATSENPSFLTFSNDKNYLLAVNENSTGSVETFSVSNGDLTYVSRSSTGGGNPCYVSTNDEGYVLVSNYGTGNVGLLKMNTGGVLSDLLDSEQHTSDEYSNAHAHSAQFESNGSTIISADLGINELWFSKVDNINQKLVSSGSQQSLMMPEGSGPRHFVIHPNGEWIYVVNEYGNTVVLVNKSSTGIFSVSKSISTLPSDYSGTSYCADIHISSDNKFLYASNRGHNSIVIFSINQGDGSLTTIGYESTRGDHPRNFSLSPDDNYLVVTNQVTNNIISFKRDKETGLLEYKDEIDASLPVCILFNE